MNERLKRIISLIIFAVVVLFTIGCSMAAQNTEDLALIIFSAFVLFCALAGALIMLENWKMNSKYVDLISGIFSIAFSIYLIVNIIRIVV